MTARMDRPNVEACLDQVARVEGVVRAFACIEPEAVRWQAKRVANGSLSGVPVAVKDVIGTADLPTRYGSPVEMSPATDAAVVTRLRAAGAVVFGKTTTSEFAVGIACEPTRNPWDTTRIPGGSSGGSAAAVAARMVPAAIGSDTGGSTRIPAALCGVVGVRPTRGLVPVDGVFPGAPTLDRVGPIGRTVDDAELLLCCLAGVTSTMDTLSLNGVRIGLITDWLAEATSEVRNVVADAARVLESLGARIVEVAESVTTEQVTSAYLTLARYELAAQHQLTPTGHNPGLSQAIATGRATSRHDYATARRQVREISAAWQTLIEANDVAALIGPTVPMTACTPAELSPLQMTYGRFTVPISLAGLPVVTQPAGFAAGLPVGLQWIGRPGDDFRLLAAARAYEQVTRWPEQAPPVVGAAS